VSLRVEQLIVRADRTPGITHEFAKGELCVVLGRNQAGKTSLCRQIAGLELSPPGSVCIDGVDVSRIGARDRSVAMVYQAFVNYPQWSVARNLASPMRGRDKADIRAAVEDIALRLGIGDLLERFPHELSGGQQQRVAIGRALAGDARVLVLDEPLVNLDFKLREELEDQLRTLIRDTDLCVIYTTSDPLAAFALGDQVLLLDDGHLLQSGKPVDVYTGPKSLAAADLMSDPGVNTVATTDGLLAVRPEHLTLAAQTPGSASFAATVLERETNGSETFIHCRHDDASSDQIWVARCAGLCEVHAGDQLTLYADPANLMRFSR
jgi:glycerol transport system ATP-binding protein